MTRRTIEGVLLVDKPAGLTSHDVVAIARRAVAASRVGHTGTLDPFATGLLVLLVGRATRLAPYVEGEPKVYRASIRFGAETDTGDATGRVLRSAPLPDEDAVDSGMASLTGHLLQEPPAFSAKKVAGRRAYAAARAGEPVALAPAPVMVHGWKVLGRSAELLDAEITCGGGTYIRALARDLGRAARSAAHLASLRRIKSGIFDVADATTLDDLREQRFELLESRAAVPHMPSRVLTDMELTRVRHGNAVEDLGAASRVALVDPVGELVAISEREGGLLRPRVVLAEG